MDVEPFESWESPDGETRITFVHDEEILDIEGPTEEELIESLLYPQFCDVVFDDFIILHKLSLERALSAPTRGEESHMLALAERTVCTCDFCKWCQRLLPTL